jgi:protein YIPF5/7
MSIYFLLNAMSEQGIDAYRVVSVLGYCLLPMVGVGAMSVGVRLEYVPLIDPRPLIHVIPLFIFRNADPCNYSRGLGYFLSLLSILWCTYAASGIFVSVLRMSDQRLLIAYPIGLLYGCFALLSVFNVNGVNTK